MAYPITGIDVSAYQPKIDWAKVRDGGHRFAYLKATEGESYVSPTFKAQWNGALGAGLVVGAYHFAQPDADATDDADRFVDEVGDFGRGHLSPVLDIETANGLGPVALVNWCQMWVERVESLTSVWPVIYTGPNFWRWHLLPAGERAQRLTSWRLWQAQYARSLTPMRDAPNWKPLIWQWTGSGVCPGIKGKVDLNRFLGTEAEFRQLAALEPDP